MADNTLAGEQRTLAVRMFNQTWDLIDTKERTAAQDRQMLTSACTSRELWQDIGGATEWATGDWQVAHVAALLGHASLSLEFATAAYEGAWQSEVPLWLKASTCEGLARAHSVAGHAEERDAWITRARQLLADLDDPEDRELIASQLATIES